HVTVPADSLTPREVAAIEVWARTWRNLRADGTNLGPRFTALGATVRIRSLPYPTLATADRFRVPGVTSTPLGMIGVEIIAVVPRANASQVINLLSAALTRAT